MNVVLAMDAAWNGLGWTIATEQGPIACGHVKLAGFEWRIDALNKWLERELVHVVTDAQLIRRPTDPPLRLVIEEPPMTYKAASRGFAKGAAGNQTAVGYGMGRLTGALELWWWRHTGLGYPWLVNPGTWRSWWQVGGRGRGERKERAIALAREFGWGDHLAPYRWTGDDGGALGDVAESMLLGVGAARHADRAPTGPIARPPKADKPKPRKRKPTTKPTLQLTPGGPK